MKKFYAFEYKSGRDTTTGNPHPITGRLSICGQLAVFPTTLLRDDWGNDTPAYNRTALSSEHTRAHCLGLSLAQYAELVADSLADHSE